MEKTIQDEVDQNYEAFEKMLPTILPKHRGKYALMRNCQVLGYYTTPEDARVTAEKFIEDHIFSIQFVGDNKIDLGYYNYAVVVA